MKSFLSRCAILALSTVLGTGCATMKKSIVAKPEINQIRKVAIVSVTAPQKVPHKSGKGEVSGWGDDHRKAIADQAFAAYSAEFKKLGWEVIPAAQLAALPIYKENFAPVASKSDKGLGKTLNKLAAASAEGTYFSPSGLYPVAWEESGGKSGTMTLDLGNLSLNKNKDLKTKMQEVAAKSGADAALLVQADYCYDDGMVYVGKAKSGTGSAVLTGAAAVYAVTPKGVEVIKMKRIAKACGGEPRVASDGQTAMVSGVLLYDSDKIRKMFKEVAEKSAAETVRQIKSAMKD